MTDRVDQFESVFKRAVKERFRYARPSIRHVVVVTDIGSSQAAALLVHIQQFLKVLEDEEVRWTVLTGEDLDGKSALLEKIAGLQADLVVTERNLKQTDKNTLHSLGAYLDTLSQVAPMPVVVLPDEHYRQNTDCMQGTRVSMVVTDHLLGDYRLINYAVRFTEPAGECHLCHIEDERAFRYYLDAISKIPAINTAQAETELRRQLMKQPADYIQSAISVLKDNHVSVKLHTHVLMGHKLHEYRRLAEGCRADLIVMNSKDQDQLAMHGMAYPIAVEFRHLPLLML